MHALRHGRRQGSREEHVAFGKVNLVVRKGPDGRMQLEEVLIPEMPAELKQIIQENQ